MNRCVIGDCREVLPTLDADTFACCVTSPPYFGLRDYGHPQQIGLEKTLSEYIAELVAVFAMVRRALRPDGTLWLNLGDSYAGSYGAQSRGMATSLGKGTMAARQVAAAPRNRQGAMARTPGLKSKDMMGVPWRVALALQADGWWLRSDIVWSKPNAMPSSVTDRPTSAHEYVFLLSKSADYHYDADAIAEPVSVGHRGSLFPSARRLAIKPDTSLKPRVEHDTRNARSVWTIPTEPYDGAHFAVMPAALASRCILAGSPPGGAVLDPFFGSGTVGQVAESNGRDWLGIDLSYETLSSERTAQKGLRFGA